MDLVYMVEGELLARALVTIQCIQYPYPGSLTQFNALYYEKGILAY